MAKPQFGYWNLRGLGQSIKFAAEFMGVDYEETVFDDTKEDVWQQKKATLGMESPNLPYWIDDKEKMSESKAILKYIIRKYQPKLLPTDISELVRTEVIEGIVGDVDRMMSMSVYMNTEATNGWFEMAVPAKMESLSKILGDKKFFMGAEPTFVDFLAYETFYRLKTYFPKYIEGHKNLLTYVDNFEKLPRIAAYMKSPRFIKAPCYGPKAAKRI